MKKWVSATFINLGIFGVIIGIFYMVGYYFFHQKYVPSQNVYKERIAYINPDEALISEGFETCGEYIFDYYNPERPTYTKGKNGLKKFILTNYKNKGYIDSGYLNIRFVINCKGETGRYVIHENDLDLIPKKFNKELKDQLFKLTTQVNQWNPNVIRKKKVDSYMYISYRIENGEIVEILP